MRSNATTKVVLNESDKEGLSLEELTIGHFYVVLGGQHEGEVVIASYPGYHAVILSGGSVGDMWTPPNSIRFRSMRKGESLTVSA